MSESRDFKAGLTTDDGSGPRLQSAFQSQTRDGPREVSSTQHSADIQRHPEQVEHPQLTSDLDNHHVSFVEDEVKPKKSTRGSEEVTRSGEELEKDEYLNDAVHRPVVHHRSSHVPALTERMPNDGRFLSETRSTKF